MKNFRLTLLLLCSFCLALNSQASSVKPSFSESTDITRAKPAILSNDQLKVLQMRQFAKMSVKDYETLKGKKLNLFQKLSFNITKHRVNKMLKAYDYGDGPTTLQKISWFLKGLILGPIALLLGYIFLQDEERELIKWIWFGFAGFAIILTIVLLTI